MAAGKKKPAKGKKTRVKGRGRIPTKRSINLILIDEKRINPFKAALGVLLITALAVVFSKYMVLDRLNEMSAAANRASEARMKLQEAESQLEGFGEIEDTYAHYTYAGMTQAELDLVDRNKILDLVSTILPGGDTMLNPQEFVNRVIALIEQYAAGGENAPTQEEFAKALGQLIRRIIPRGYRVHSCSVDGTRLSISISGSSLERLNKLARQLEKSPIVDSCAIINASKSKQVKSEQAVAANLIVYLQNPPEGGTAK